MVDTHHEQGITLVDSNRVIRGSAIGNVDNISSIGVMSGSSMRTMQIRDVGKNMVRMPRFVGTCITSIALLIGIVTGIMVSMITPIGLHTAVAAQANGSLTIDARWNRESAHPVPLTGDTYSIVRIASADLNNDGTITAYHTLDRFKNYDQQWGNLDASESNIAAKRLEAFVGEKDQYDASLVVRESGYITFSNLEPGVYLVSRTGIAQANAAYQCDPFLAYIPRVENNGILWDVTVEPKYGHDEEENPPSPPTPTEPFDPSEPSQPPEHDNTDNGNEDGTNGSNTPSETARTGAAIVIPSVVGAVALVVALIIQSIRRRQ